MRVFTNPTSPAPEVHLLSNGRYHVVVTSAGGAYSRWRELAVTRWREDATRDCWGTFVYLRDEATGRFLVHCPSAHPVCDKKATKPSSARRERSFGNAMRALKSTPKSAYVAGRMTWSCRRLADHESFPRRPRH